MDVRAQFLLYQHNETLAGFYFHAFLARHGKAEDRLPRLAKLNSLEKILLQCISTKHF